MIDALAQRYGQMPSAVMAEPARLVMGVIGAIGPEPETESDPLHALAELSEALTQ